MEQTHNYVYLGGSRALAHVEVGPSDVDGQLVGAWTSANVARRYGAVVTRLVVNTVPTKVVSLEEWRSNFFSLADVRKEGFQAVRVTGEPEDFDLPVDMLVALDENALTVHSTVSASELLVLSAGLPQVHQPQGPSFLGWNHLVLASGSEQKKLEARGWAFFDSGVCRGSVAADNYWREYLVCAIPLAKGWLIQDNYGDSEGFAETRADALCMADWWRRHEISRRREYLADIDKPYPELFTADDEDFPF